MSQRCHGPVREPYGDCGTLWHQWGNHRMHADAVWTGGVRYRAGIIQSAPKLRAQLDGVFSNYLRRAKRHAILFLACRCRRSAQTRPSQVTARSVTCGSDATSFIRPKNTVLGTAPGSLISLSDYGSHTASPVSGKKLLKLGEWPARQDRQASSRLCGCLWSPI